MENSRGSFGSKLGVILATAGSAVGLGNIWRFPYMTGQNGGAAFILIYLVCIFMLGIPGMVAEFIIGRHSAANAARSYKNLSNGKPWGVIGYMGVFTSMIILGFYAVVAGWCLQYLYASIMTEVQGDANFVKEYFASFSSDVVRPTLWTIAFILLTHVVVVKGVRNGIERASKILMPLLFVLLVVLVVASCSLQGAWKGVEFLLKPDFSKVDPNVMIEALGGTGFLLAESWHGLPLYLCLLLQPSDQSSQDCHTDSFPRYADSHSGRTDDFSCSLLRGRAARQRSVAYLHHPAQCVQ